MPTRKARDRVPAKTSCLPNTARTLDLLVAAIEAESYRKVAVSGYEFVLRTNKPLILLALPTGFEPVLQP